MVDENFGRIKNYRKNIPIDLEMFKKYPYKYKITNHDEVVQIINSDNKDYCYFVPFLYEGKTIDIYDVETKELIYKSRGTGRNVIDGKNFNEFIEDMKNSK